MPQKHLKMLVNISGEALPSKDPQALACSVIELLSNNLIAAFKLRRHGFVDAIRPDKNAQICVTYTQNVLTIDLDYETGQSAIPFLSFAGIDSSNEKILYNLGYVPRIHPVMHTYLESGRYEVSRVGGHTYRLFENYFEPGPDTLKIETRWERATGGGLMQGNQRTLSQKKALNLISKSVGPPGHFTHTQVVTTMRDTLWKLKRELTPGAKESAFNILGTKMTKPSSGMGRTYLQPPVERQRNKSFRLGGFAQPLYELLFDRITRVKGKIERIEKDPKINQEYVKDNTGERGTTWPMKLKKLVRFKTIQKRKSINRVSYPGRSYFGTKEVTRSD
ncbi:hypothetical protein BJ165DRAFT_1598237 [Panaeolus papilionaceus]|nr:hypothetical protein BJ165DRAFT_1598237 [Panaeolus papilionaceus]